MNSATNAVHTNLVYQSKLGWKPQEILPAFTAVDDQFVAGVVGLQRRLQVASDSVVGPRTYAAVLVDRIAQLKAQTSPTPEHKLERAQKIALARGKALWLQNIPDTPAHYAQIEAWIATNLGINWGWEKPYRGTFKWCAAFIAHEYYDMLPLSVRYAFFSSTYRLDKYARYLPFESYSSGPRPTSGPTRHIVELDENSTASDVAKFGGTGPRAGDILLVGDGKPHEGDHATTVESWDPVKCEFTTIEGNGNGWLPDGSVAPRAGGVVRATRPLGLPKGSAKERYIARRLIRLAPNDVTL